MDAEAESGYTDLPTDDRVLMERSKQPTPVYIYSYHLLINSWVFSQILVFRQHISKETWCPVLIYLGMIDPRSLFGTPRKRSSPQKATRLLFRFWNSRVRNISAGSRDKYTAWWRALGLLKLLQ